MLFGKTPFLKPNQLILNLSRFEKSINFLKLKEHVKKVKAFASKRKITDLPSDPNVEVFLTFRNDEKSLHAKRNSHAHFKCFKGTLPCNGKSSVNENKVFAMNVTKRRGRSHEKVAEVR